MHKASYQGKNVKGYDGSKGQWTEAEYRAATRMQAAWRMIKARKQAAEQMKMRQDALLYFSYPIYVVSLVDLIYGTVMTHLSARDLTPSNLLSLVTFGLCLIVFIVDLNRQPPIRFSLTHGVFLVAILYRLSFKASTIDQEIWTLFEGLLSESYAFLVPLITMAFHYTLFITVTSLGSVALTLVSTTSACVHLLFFFQFFDFFLYASVTLTHRLRCPSILSSSSLFVSFRLAHLLRLALLAASTFFSTAARATSSSQ